MQASWNWSSNWIFIYKFDIVFFSCKWQVRKLKMKINLILLLNSATCHTSWYGISWNSMKSMKTKLNQYYSQNIDDINKTLKTWGFICTEKEEHLPSNHFLSVFFSIFSHISMLRLYLMKKTNTNQWNINIAKA